MEAVILAGGFGTRLQSVVKDLPKPMADINGRPFLAYMLDYLSESPIDRVIMSVGFRHEAIINYFGSAYRDMGIEYVIENEPLGTGGAIRESLRRVRAGDALVLNGDTFFCVDIPKLLAHHAREHTLLTLSVKPMKDFDRYGTVRLESSRVRGFEEKSFQRFGYINGGIYVINKGLLEYLDRLEKRFSFETDFLEKILAEVEVSAHIDDGYFIDIGIPEEYARAQRELPEILPGGSRR